MHLHFCTSYSSENFIVDLAIPKQSVIKFSSLTIELSPRFESNTGMVVIYQFHERAENSSYLNESTSVCDENFIKERGRVQLSNDGSNGLVSLS